MKKRESGMHLHGNDPQADSTLMSASQYSRLHNIPYTKVKSIVLFHNLKDYAVNSFGAKVYRQGDINACMQTAPEEAPTRTFAPQAGVPDKKSIDRKRDLECEKLELNIDILKGKYVKVEDVLSELSELLKFVQQRVLVIYPRSLPHKLHNKSLRELQAVLADEGKAFLNELLTVAPTLISDGQQVSDSDGEDAISVG